MNYPDLQPFQSLLSALHYRRNCPFCHSTLEMYNKRLRSEYDYDRGYVVFELDEYGGNTLCVNFLTEEVELIVARREDLEPIYSGTVPSSIYYNSRMSTSYIRLDGEIGHAISIRCMNRECGQFSYTLQMWVDLIQKKLLGVYLNSELMSIDIDDNTHEIKNVYTTNKTHYTYHSKDGSSKTATIPLIKLDTTKPHDMLERIKNLIIFS